VTTSRRQHRTRPTAGEPRTSGESFASVYVHMAATLDAVRPAVARLPKPPGVRNIRIDDRSITDTFGCKIAIDLTGTFNEAREGPVIARQYAQRLSALIGVPAFALYDLLRSDSTKFLS
jgi:hypothetical protein